MSDNTTQWVESLVQSINCTSVSMQDAKHYDTPEFYEAAKAIVEPMGVEDAYYSFMEEDMENWVQFITSTIGSDWGVIAQLVYENGY